MPFDTRSLVNPHWRARLIEIQDLLIVAHTADDVSKAMMQLTAVLHDEWDAKQYPVVQLVQLVRDASRLLNTTQELGWGSDVKDWNRSAEPFVKG